MRAVVACHVLWARAQLRHSRGTEHFRLEGSRLGFDALLLDNNREREEEKNPFLQHSEHIHKVKR